MYAHRPEGTLHMAPITTVFCDIGGVILTNGWDHDSRRKAATRFDFDWEDFKERHDDAMLAFDTGRIGLHEYMRRTLFYRPRPFSEDEFKTFMFAQSRPHPETFAIVEQVARSHKYLMVALNNEPLELNQYRIDHFQLRRCFGVFLSSCFLGVRKPDDAIYRLALQITQSAAEECLFIDDRVQNMEPAQRLGMDTILYQNPAQLRDALERNGIAVESD